MASEELTQRGYWSPGQRLKGTPFGTYEQLDLGSTTFATLAKAGVELSVHIPDFPFEHYRLPSPVTRGKPDRLYGEHHEETNKWVPVGVAEFKDSGRFLTEANRLKAAEQALFSAMICQVSLAAITDGIECRWIDVPASLAAHHIRYWEDYRPISPSVIDGYLRGNTEEPRDPSALAKTVWQTIWHATKAEPKECLMTFIEIFLLKFLTDNLDSKRGLPADKNFWALDKSVEEFHRLHGVTAIEYYVTVIRPHIKAIFPDNTVVDEPRIRDLFGLQTIVSKTSIVNGFVFLKSSKQTVASYNRTFLEVLGEFKAFGPLRNIDPEFKLRLYEIFLKQSPTKSSLGQFFTPRNVVKAMIDMAQLSTLPDGAVVLDPAAGVGGFILEPLLWASALAGNVQFANGKATRRVLTVGVDVDQNTHILAKANLLLHLAELLNLRSTSMEALNKLMAETFILLNDNETLGSLERPPLDAVDIILTNPPYVTRGSGAYRDEIGHASAELIRHYDGVGLGLEAYFLRYISGALKPGGTAFTIVPTGLLNRTDRGTKRMILRECNLVAAIRLPSGTFFHTGQETHILVLRKRFSEVDDRPPVLCALAGSIGETLDSYRTPQTHDNELQSIANRFVERDNTGQVKGLAALPNLKLISSREFGEDDRWDVQRFWSDDELVSLGHRDRTIDATEFVDSVTSRLDELVGEVAMVLPGDEAVDRPATKTFRLGDGGYVRLRAGDRIRKADRDRHPGDLPVLTCSNDPSHIAGRVSEQWMRETNRTIFTGPCVTVNADGSVGCVFVRQGCFALTDNVITVTPVRADLDVNYLATAIRNAIEGGGYSYTSKLYMRRLSVIEVSVPTMQDGSLDPKKQQLIASTSKQIDQLKWRLKELGRWAGAVRIA